MSDSELYIQLSCFLWVGLVETFPQDINWNGTKVGQFNSWCSARIPMAFSNISHAKLESRLIHSVFRSISLGCLADTFFQQGNQRQRTKNLLGVEEILKGQLVDTYVDINTLTALLNSWLILNKKKHFFLWDCEIWDSICSLWEVHIIHSQTHRLLLLSLVVVQNLRKMIKHTSLRILWESFYTISGLE